MSILLMNINRIVPSQLTRRNLLPIVSRLVSSSQYNNDLLRAEKQQQQQQNESSTPKRSPRVRRYHYYVLSIAAGALIGTIYALRQVRKREGRLPEYVANIDLLERKAMESRPSPPPVTKRITFDASPRVNFPFKVTLYQYVTCPFCCKVRAYLNYNRIPYDIVEVNSITHKEAKWSLYNRVPIVVIENEQIQVNDSTMIISAIESYLRQPTINFRNIMNLYESTVLKDQKGNLDFNYANRYFIVQPLENDKLILTNNDENEVKNASRSFLMKFLFGTNRHPENNADKSLTDNINKPISNDDNEFERKWREWVDNKFVHVISPNIYCTLKQSYNTFLWFSKAGEWEDIFPWYQRWMIVYLGAIVMRFVAIRLKNKYHLNDNVRLSLYECGNEWADAIGDKDFLGGSKPNLADLNVYGVLTAMEGCEAFQDLMKNTKMQPWFDRMKNLIESHRIDTPVHSKS